MSRIFIHKETGKQMSRVEIVEAFEKEEGRSLSAGEFEALLYAVEYYQNTGVWITDATE